MTDAEEQLRQQTRAALKSAGVSQACACRRLGVSTKHLSHMLTGRAPLTLDWAEQILTLCGQRLLVAAVAETASPAAPRQSLDDLTSDQLDALYERADTYRDAWKLSRARWWKANARIDELDTRVRELEAEVARLTQAVTDADDDAAEAREHNERTCETVTERDHLRATIDRVRAWAHEELRYVDRTELLYTIDHPPQPVLAEEPPVHLVKADQADRHGASNTLPA